MAIHYTHLIGKLSNLGKTAVAFLRKRGERLKEILLPPFGKVQAFAADKIARPLQFGKGLKALANFISLGWASIFEFFLRLKLRVKLSIIVGLSIIFVTFVISSVAVQIQERELRLQTETVGNMIVRSLQSVSKDPLLLNDYVTIQDYINNFVRRKIHGLEALAVVDRSGKIVAHAELENVEKTISAERFDEIVRADSAIQVETPTHYRFVQAVYTFNKRKIFLGGCSVSFSKAVLLAPIQEMNRQIVLISLLVSCLAILIVYLISKKLLHVIIVLSNAARRVGAGDLKVTVITRIKDEVGSLAKEFNFMVAQLREKIEMQKFVSRSTMQMISEKKEATLGGTRRVITAMFTDIRNFTSVSENRWPEEVVETLNHYLDVQTRIIHDHKGIVDKFIGDGIMSIFTGDKMVANAVTAAIELQRKIHEMNEQRTKDKEIVLEIGVGIATGVAVLGSIGSHDRMDYTAIGDTVNLASRLCGIAGPAQILANEDVIKRLNGQFQSKSEGKIAIKGKQEKVPVYEISYSLS